MDINLLIDQIIKSKPEFTKEDILNKASSKRTDVPHMSEYTSILLVAVDLGVKLSLDVASHTKLEHLVDKLNNVKIRGRVIWVKNEKIFTRKDGTTGTYIRACIGDSTSLSHIMFWDRSTQELEDSNFTPGVVVELSMGYTRKSFTGSIEIHMGPRAPIMSLPNEQDDFPHFEDFLKPLDQIQNHKEIVNSYGHVITEPYIKVFVREGQEAYLSRFQIIQNQNTKNVVIWDDIKQIYPWIKKGISIAIFNGVSKPGLNDEIEIHIGKTSHILHHKDASPEELIFTSSSLSSLNDGFNPKSIYVSIDAIGKIRQSAQGKQVLSIHGLDLSSDATITFMGDIVTNFKTLSLSDTIKISGLNLKIRKQENYLFCDDATNIELNPTIPEEFIPPSTSDHLTEISNISTQHKIVNITGKVVKDISETPSQFDNLQTQGEFYIEQDKNPVKISYNGIITDFGEKPKLNDNIQINGAYVDTNSLVDALHYLPLKLKAYSKVSVL